MIDKVVKRITYADTKPFLLKKHYAHRMPSISYAYGLFINDTLRGVCTFGMPASHSLCIGVCGVDYSSYVLELNRLYLDDEISEKYKDITSWFVSQSMQSLRLDFGNCIIVSYADSGMNHIGYIYQALSFTYTGKTRQRTDFYTGKNKHSRHYDKNAEQIYRSIRTSKYRYVKFVGSKTFKKYARRSLLWKVEEYPKGNRPMERYAVGDIEPKFVKIIKTNEIITEDEVKQ